jgi:arylsulfatase A-like enzyme
VLLVTVDTLRSDYLSANGYPLPTTPFLDSLFAQGVQFPNTLAPTGRTSQSIASLLTGAYPHTTGVRTLFGTLRPGVATLADLFAAHGFRTFAVLSNHLLNPTRGFAGGFEGYDSKGDARGAAGTTDAALRAVSGVSASDSLFLWVHYIDPHVPYLPPREIARQFDPGYRGPYATGFGQAGGIGNGAYPEELPKREAVFRNPLPDEVNAHIRRLYAADIRFTDAHIGRLIRTLRARLGDEWLIVFTADHGESLGEHAFFYDHGDYVYTPGLRVPLFFGQLPEGRPGGLSAGVTVEDWVSLVDVAPTVIELAGIEPTPEVVRQLEGRSLVPILRGGPLSPRPVFAESGQSYFPDLVRGRVRFDIAGRFRTVVDGNWKLIWTPGKSGDAPGDFELYDLSVDPLESHDRYAAEPDEAARLTRLLFDWVRDADAPLGTPSAEDLDQLRALGYIE